MFVSMLFLLLALYSHTHLQCCLYLLNTYALMGFVLKALVDLDAFLGFWLLTSLRTTVRVVCDIKGNLVY